ncbi:MAG: Stp1/IreP family PP2C-type Ser/Thr phosphatase [Firmicutes bacterium]|nr:Stp1/IreP family PP2C-type Ser/Thr phosphatase [Bacillota bacterium]
MQSPENKKKVKKSPLVVTASGLTDKGRNRENNEDNLLIDPELGLYIVSDGIGGHQAGEKASEVVVKVLPIELNERLRNSPQDDDGTLSALSIAIRHLNRLIFQHASEVPEYRGMGATIVSCLVKNNAAYIAHLGDSRIYLVRQGVMEQLTDDHSVVSMLRKLGKLTPQQIRSHPMKHVIMRFVGMEADFPPDIKKISLQPGDRILLCSDGLTDMLTDREIGQIILDEADLKATCKKLVDSANEAGGRDNITVVVVQYGARDDKKRKRKQKIRLKRQKIEMIPEETEV